MRASQPHLCAFAKKLNIAEQESQSDSWRCALLSRTYVLLQKVKYRGARIASRFLEVRASQPHLFYIHFTFQQSKLYISMLKYG